MKKGKLFAAFKSVDEKERIVVGVLAEESVDKDGEIFDYASSKKYFEKWNQFYAEKTKELGVEESLGNMRKMHTKTLAGKFIEMNYNDETKQIEVAAKVTDDTIWEEVMQGLYTGFSIGARYVKKWKDSATGATRWTADPFEGSLVDNPCMAGALITAVKADGTQKEFKLLGEGTHAEKGIWTAQSFLSVVGQLCDICCSMESEEQWENDEEGQVLASQIRETAKQLGDMCKQYVGHEIDEMNPEMNGVAEMADKTKQTAEPGMRPTTTVADEPGLHPAEKTAKGGEGVAAAAAAAVAPKEKPAEKATKKQLTEAVNAFVSAISAIVGEEDEQPVEQPAAAAGKTVVTNVEKTVVLKDGEAVVNAAEFEALKTKVAAQDNALVKVNEQLEKIAKMPAPSAVRTRTVSKEADVVEKGAKGDEQKPTSPVDAIKAIHAGRM